MKKSSGSRSRKQRLTAMGTRCADHVTPLYPQKLALTSPTGGGRSVGIVRVRTKATEFVVCLSNGGGWPTPRPGRFISHKETRYPLHRRLGGPQGRSGRLLKIPPSMHSNPRTVQPVVSRYTTWTIPAHYYYSDKYVIPFILGVNSVFLIEREREKCILNT